MTRTFHHRPHFKNARPHPDTCKCKACRIWRQRQRAARILERIDRHKHEAKQ